MHGAPNAPIVAAGWSAECESRQPALTRCEPSKIFTTSLALLSTEAAFSRLISLIRELPNEEPSMLNEVFHALSDPTRREIVRLLRDHDRTAGELAEHFNLAKSTLSGHFNVLKRAGLVVAERHGTRIVYSLNASALEEAVAMMLELFRVGKVPHSERKK